MHTPYTSLAIANRFIKNQGELGIEHMKLQKLVYYAYGWWLASWGLDKPRLTLERPELWKYGPVFSDLYNILRVFGRTPIFVPQSIAPFREPDKIDEQDENVLSLIDWIWGRYGHLSSLDLSEMTHRPGTSWYRVASENDFSVSPHEPIKDHYIFEEFSQQQQMNQSG